ncbi:LPXTG cell wall anchor domain-containing protein [Robertmurraya sp. DFI.2.37]|uniref:LPXTG cell wall anchor domain-containing protein n=1 Tax=Robertmurraya sp. DFI.2.37 TaxID=3031819 RepID=UPI0034D98708
MWRYLLYTINLKSGGNHSFHSRLNHFLSESCKKGSNKSSQNSDIAVLPQTGEESSIMNIISGLVLIIFDLVFLMYKRKTTIN